MKRINAARWLCVVVTLLVFMPAQAFASGVIGTIAGTGAGGYSGDGGPAIEAMLNGPQGIFLDVTRNNLYIADTLTSSVRKVDLATGIITTVAGHGHYGYNSPDGVQATTVDLRHPLDVVVDSGGNVIFVDRLEGRVRKVDAETGIISTVAGGGWNRTSDGIPATEAYMLNPVAVSIDSEDNLYISVLFDNRVRKVDAETGIITTIAGGGPYANSWDYQGACAGDGGPATEAELFFPRKVAIDAQGNIYIADNGNGRIRRVDGATGIITTIAGPGVEGGLGDNGPASEAFLGGTKMLAMDESGNLYVSDVNRVRKIDAATGVITTIAGTGESGFSGDGGPSLEAQLAVPVGLAVTPGGDFLYIADLENNRVRKVHLDFAPPVVSVSATPDVIYPPNGKMVEVTVNGSASDTDTGIGSLLITVTDEYGIYNMTVPGFGSTIELEASRSEEDMDGRQYTITATAQDFAGNVSTAATQVTVLHNQ